MAFCFAEPKSCVLLTVDKNLQILAGISKATRLLHQGEEVSAAIRAAVAELGQATAVDRCYVFQLEVLDGVRCLSQTYEWAGSGISEQIDNPDLQGMPAAEFPEIMDILQKDEALYGIVAELDNPVFREKMQAQEIVSFLFTPIFSNGLLWGFIGYDDCEVPRRWMNEEVDALFTVAKNIGIRISWDALRTNLEEVNESFDLAVRGSKQGLYRWYIQENSVFFSEYYWEMLGYRKEAMEQTFDAWVGLIHPEDVSWVFEKLQAYIHGELGEYAFEYRLLHKDGQYRWIYASGKLKLDEEGKPWTLTGFHTDVTASRHQSHMYKLLSENSGDIISLHETAKTGLLYVSSSVTQVLGYSMDEVNGMELSTTIFPNDLAGLLDAMKVEKLQEGEEGLHTFRIQHKNGHYVWIEAKFRYWKEFGGVENILQVVSRDITSRVEEEKARAETLLRDMELKALKSGFISMASHQFKTPLTVIYSNMELLEIYARNPQAIGDGKMDRIFKRVKDEVDRMTELMDNILIFGRYEAGQTKRFQKDLMIHELIEKIDEAHFSNEKDGRRTVFEVIGEPYLLLGDEIMLGHVFSNLLSNAFKYSKDAPAPKTVVRYSVEAIEIDVIDYGIGVPEQDQKHLFDSFYRASNVSTIVGSGLGLPIVKEFVEKHNGVVRIQSKENQGTTVTIVLRK